MKEAVKEIKKINLTDESYSKSLPPAELHWIIADRNGAATVEFVKDGLRIYKNNAGVLTNNPPFDGQVFNLNNYMRLSASEIKNTFFQKPASEKLQPRYGRFGTAGRSVLTVALCESGFFRLNSVSEDGEQASVNQFFHILGTVAQPRGACRVRKDGYEITVYSSCCNAR